MQTDGQELHEVEKTREKIQHLIRTITSLLCDSLQQIMKIWGFVTIQNMMVT